MKIATGDVTVSAALLREQAENYKRRILSELDNEAPDFGHIRASLTALQDCHTGAFALSNTCSIEDRA